MIAMLRHSAYWSKDIMSRFYLRGAKYAVLRMLLTYFVDKALKFAETLTPDAVLSYIEQAKERLSRSLEAPEPILTPPK